MSNSKDIKKFTTLSGLELKECYNAQDLPKDLGAKSGTPGQYPYRRGIRETMYRGRHWTMRQYAGFGNAKETNERYHYLLKRGQTGLSVAFDLPTQMGRDADHKLSKGEVGRVGVSICSVEDMEILLDKIPLQDVSISMTINATAATLLAFLLVVAKRRGIDWKQLNGTIQNDVLKEYIARGTYIYPPTPALRIITDIFEFCAKEVPKWNTISISGYHIREAGSTAVQELAFTFANAIAYVEAAVKRGLKVDDFAPRLAFFFNGQIDFLEEICKFRAARSIWAKLMKERFGAKKAESMLLRFHTQTAGSSLTAQQPLNNVVRTTIEAMAAILGGTQSLHTNSFDEALGLPTEDAAKLALRTQQVIASESGIVNSVDPLAGAYLIESLTQQIEDRCFDELKRIDVMGGMLKAIDSGYPQSEIEASAYEFQKKLENKEQIVVGVNHYLEDDGLAPRMLKLNPSLEQEQCARVTKLKKNRDNKAVNLALEELRLAAKSQQNLMGFILTAAESLATLGEIADVLRDAFGEYQHS